MTPMTMDEILARISELKQESEEKDTVMTEQMKQIQELESKVSELEGEMDELRGAASRADEMVEKLSEALS